MTIGSPKSDWSKKSASKVHWRELSYLRYVLVFLVLLTIIIYENTTHPEIGDDWGVLLLRKPASQTGRTDRRQRNLPCIPIGQNYSCHEDSSHQSYEDLRPRFLPCQLSGRPCPSFSWQSGPLRSGSRRWKGIVGQAGGKSAPPAWTTVSCTRLDKGIEYFGSYDYSTGTYERQLKLLSGIRMLNDELTERLSDTMPATFFADLVKLVIGKIEAVFWLNICPEPLARPRDFVRCGVVRTHTLHRTDSVSPGGRSSEMMSSSFNSN